MALRILFADDHGIAIVGAETILKEIQDVSVVCTAQSGQEVLEYLAEHTVDIAILDYSLGDLTAKDILIKMDQIAPKTKVIILSMWKMGRRIYDLIELGIHAYIVKSSILDHLVAAIQVVRKGGCYFDPEACTALAEYIRFFPVWRKLTAQEIKIIEGMGTSKSIKDLATSMGIAISSVHSHKAQILKKLGISEIDLIKQARELGLLD